MEEEAKQWKCGGGGGEKTIEMWRWWWWWRETGYKNLHFIHEIKTIAYDVT